MRCDRNGRESGFGGSVAGLRLRQRGHRVLMLEKGRRWGTNDFPRSTWDLRNFLWNPAARLQGLLRIDFLRHAAVLSGVDTLADLWKRAGWGNRT